MKKIFFLFIFLVVSNAVNAQRSRLGIKTGVNAATLSNYEDVNHRIGFHLGGVGEFQVNEKIYIQPELVYSQQGFSKHFEGKDTGIKLNYVTVSGIGKYYVIDGFCFEGGPFAAFNVSAKEGRGEYIKDIKEHVDGIDYGVGFGANYMLVNTLNFGVRYNMGMKQVFTNKLLSDKEIKNSVLQFSIGYFF